MSAALNYLVLFVVVMVVVASTAVYLVSQQASAPVRIEDAEVVGDGSSFRLIATIRGPEGDRLREVYYASGALTWSGDAPIGKVEVPLEGDASGLTPGEYYRLTVVTESGGASAMAPFLAPVESSYQGPGGGRTGFWLASGLLDGSPSLVNRTAVALSGAVGSPLSVVSEMPGPAELEMRVYLLSGPGGANISLSWDAGTPTGENSSYWLAAGDGSWITFRDASGASHTVTWVSGVKVIPPTYSASDGSQGTSSDFAYVVVDAPRGSEGSTYLLLFSLGGEEESVILRIVRKFSFPDNASSAAAAAASAAYIEGAPARFLVNRSSDAQGVDTVRAILSAAGAEWELSGVLYRPGDTGLPNSQGFLVGFGKIVWPADGETVGGDPLVVLIKGVGTEVTLDDATAGTGVSLNPIAGTNYAYAHLPAPKDGVHTIYLLQGATVADQVTITYRKDDPYTTVGPAFAPTYEGSGGGVRSWSYDVAPVWVRFDSETDMVLENSSAGFALIFGNDSDGRGIPLAIANFGEDPVEITSISVEGTGDATVTLEGPGVYEPEEWHPPGAVHPLFSPLRYSTYHEIYNATGVGSWVVLHDTSRSRRAFALANFNSEKVAITSVDLSGDISEVVITYCYYSAYYKYDRGIQVTSSWSGYYWLAAGGPGLVYDYYGRYYTLTYDDEHSLYAAPESKYGARHYEGQNTKASFVWVWVYAYGDGDITFGFSDGNTFTVHVSTEEPPSGGSAPPVEVSNGGSWSGHYWLGTGVPGSLVDRDGNTVGLSYDEDKHIFALDKKGYGSTGEEGSVASFVLAEVSLGDFDGTITFNVSGVEISIRVTAEEQKGVILTDVSVENMGFFTCDGKEVTDPWIEDEELYLSFFRYVGGRLDEVARVMIPPAEGHVAAKTVNLPLAPGDGLNSTLTVDWDQVNITFDDEYLVWVAQDGGSILQEDLDGENFVYVGLVGDAPLFRGAMALAVTFNFSDGTVLELPVVVIGVPYYSGGGGRSTYFIAADAEPGGQVSPEPEGGGNLWVYEIPWLLVAAGKGEVGDRVSARISATTSVLGGDTEADVRLELWAGSDASAPAWGSLNHTSYPVFDSYPGFSAPVLVAYGRVHGPGYGYLKHVVGLTRAEIGTAPEGILLNAVFAEVDVGDRVNESLRPALLAAAPWRATMESPTDSHVYTIEEIAGEAGVDFDGSWMDTLQTTSNFLILSLRIVATAPTEPDMTFNITISFGNARTTITVVLGSGGYIPGAVTARIIDPKDGDIYGGANPEVNVLYTATGERVADLRVIMRVYRGLNPTSTDTLVSSEYVQTGESVSHGVTLETPNAVIYYFRIELLVWGLDSRGQNLSAQDSVLVKVYPDAPSLRVEITNVSPRVFDEPSSHNTVNVSISSGGDAEGVVLYWSFGDKSGVIAAPAGDVTVQISKVFTDNGYLKLTAVAYNSTNDYNQNFTKKVYEEVWIATQTGIHIDQPKDQSTFESSWMAPLQPVVVSLVGSIDTSNPVYVNVTGPNGYHRSYMIEFDWDYFFEKKDPQNGSWRIRINLPFRDPGVYEIVAKATSGEGYPLTDTSHFALGALYSASIPQIVLDNLGSEVIYLDDTEADVTLTFVAEAVPRIEEVQVKVSSEDQGTILNETYGVFSEHAEVNFTFHALASVRYSINILVVYGYPGVGGLSYQFAASPTARASGLYISSPSSGEIVVSSPGEEVTVHFVFVGGATSAQYSIYFDHDLIDSGTVTSSSRDVTFTVPEDASGGRHLVEVEASAGYAAAHRSFYVVTIPPGSLLDITVENCTIGERDAVLTVSWVMAIPARHLTIYFNFTYEGEEMSFPVKIFLKPALAGQTEIHFHFPPGSTNLAVAGYARFYGGFEAWDEESLT